MTVNITVQERIAILLVLLLVQGISHASTQVPLKAVNVAHQDGSIATVAMIQWCQYTPSITRYRKLDRGVGMRLCHYGNSVTILSVIVCRFVFPNGANYSGIPNGYWRMDIHANWGEENNTVFTRMHPDPHIYYQFAVPLGESYACSNNNSLNAYTIYHGQNDTDSVSSPIKAIHLPGLQVRWYLLGIDGFQSVPIKCLTFRGQTCDQEVAMQQRTAMLF